MTDNSEETSRATAIAYLRVVGLAALIGIPAALVAALFLGLIHVLENWLWHDVPASLGFAEPPWFLIVGLPVAGAVLVVAARALLPGDGGHPPLEGLKAGETPLANIPGIVLAALGSLAFGAVLGPEIALVMAASA